MSTHLVTPGLENSFWVNLIGKGYSPPTRWFRWCTSKMKIKLLAGLKEQLPAIFATPPYPRPALTEGQVAFYRQRLIKRLEEYEALTAQDSLLSLPASRARLLYRQLTEFEGAKRPAGPLIQLAREVRELEQSVERINRQLAGAEQLSRDRQEELQGLSERERLLAEQILDLKDRKRSLEREQAIAKAENTKVENTLGRLAEELERASQVRGKVELAKRLESRLEQV